MALPTAPCTNCRATVVYGEPKCRQCNQPFHYGAGNVPVPSPQQIQEALIAAAAEAISGPNRAAPAPSTPPPSSPPSRSPAPATASPKAAAPTTPSPAWLDAGRHDEVGQVRTEDIPGFIDSGLFASYSQVEVGTGTMPGLETHHAPEVDVHTEDLSAVLDVGRHTDVGPVRTEDIPGFVDSSLFAAYTPAEVRPETIPGLESNENAGTRSAPVSDEGGALTPCVQCGTPHDVSRCPSCGAAVLD